MNLVPRRDILEMSFKLYKILGETFGESVQSNETKTKSKIFRSFTCFVLFVNSILTIGSFSQAQGEIYVKSLEGSLSILHVSQKISYLFFYIYVLCLLF